ncbi:epoxyqueuosine reductase [Hylemonella gracilis str. Niagara R]|uniref:Epoxyqueuosine reductase n=1 Tax=Hylemonella gracilis str. Niagara R TaxID=1458275 RepID=A0A016XKE2_9BURK|nr:tRNA epoxyqueuosine(34) reductase QueG [Hylemonella gracilis]EYC52017.1 epoxyqueuosine reductase [Hylemonella gracilis str. Niagara R]
MQVNSHIDKGQFISQVRVWARELGFSQIGVHNVDLSSAEAGLKAWLSHGFHGEMAYMAAHGMKRARPAELVPGTVSVVTARMDYLPRDTPEGWQAVELARVQSTQRPREGVISLYARGRDYHKVLRSRLQKLAERMEQHLRDQVLAPVDGSGRDTAFQYRVFTDSAPVLEAELAAGSGLGWRGKHTLVLDRDAGSMFFLGEIFLNLDLPPTEPVSPHCGSCSACITVCPTQAILGPGRLDARRCISYLTIEHPGAIPEELRPLMGQRIYGCDDCQLVCPWNKYARRSTLPDFDARADMARGDLLTLLAWDEAEFLRRTEGSAIRRIGHARWRRNILVALGNALRGGTVDAEDSAAIRAALQIYADPGADPLLREHALWALAAPAASGGSEVF